MSAVSSPCISVCQMDIPSGLCTGCLRTIDEIVAWSAMDDAGKQKVWTLIGQRQSGAVLTTHSRLQSSTQPAPRE